VCAWTDISPHTVYNSQRLPVISWQFRHTGSVLTSDCQNINATYLIARLQWLCFFVEVLMQRFKEVLATFDIIMQFRWAWWVCCRSRAVEIRDGFSQVINETPWVADSGKQFPWQPTQQLDTQQVTFRTLTLTVAKQNHVNSNKHAVMGINYFNGSLTKTTFYQHRDR